MSTPGDRIRAAREAKNWKQEDLANEARISKGFLSDVENDKRDIGARYLLQIADALGVTMDYLQKGKTTAANAKTEAVSIPPSLSEFAEELKLSYAQTLTLLEARQSVLFRRSSRKATTPTKEEWKKLHAAIKQLYPDD